MTPSRTTPTPGTSRAHLSRLHLSRRLLALGLIPVVGILAAACGSSGGGQASTTTTSLAPSATAPTPATGPAPVVTTKTVGGLGKILVNEQGQVLYSFTKGGAPVPCSASCLQVWPAVTLPPGVTAPTGSSGVGTLGTTTSNGVTQVTVGGLPLFTYAGDSAPGVANGNDLVSFGGTWKVVKAQ
jgi:predicted lipoprotein with Yx(FWY)xxD motif